jgi:16S rRNA processing protein RimM
MASWDEMVLVGRIARPHGIRGHLFVNPETDFVDERFVPGATMWTRSDRGEEPLTIAAARVQNGRPVVAFEGFSSLDDIERLGGLELRVPEETLRPLEAGAYYRHQLVGCAVETTTGAPVGVVKRVGGGVAGSLLAVDGARGEILIPFVAEICREVDVAAQRIKIDPPEGLLELNDSGQRAAGSRRK